MPWQGQKCGFGLKDKKQKKAFEGEELGSPASRSTSSSVPKEKRSSSASKDPSKKVVVSEAQSVAGRELPSVPSGLEPDSVTLALFYQYVEPEWTAKQHKKAISSIMQIAEQHEITGRGRCAPEGLNCTLTASPEDMRAFCQALRDWDPVFWNTDFKLTDGLDAKKRFKAFTLRKTEELVNYGLEGEKAPAINKYGGEHLEATEYHERMKNPNAVIIDVRNYYESAIGHFQPPQGGAELIDPKMRNSNDFAPWLSAPETQEKLKGKEVLMYCTGGIRCERATALLNQISDASPDLDLQGIKMVRGGIERYLRTFPEGGYWKGKNYLFDRRMEQVPVEKSEEALEADVESCCCLCKKKYGHYRGQFKCAKTICAVPVIVCPDCAPQAKNSPEDLQCPLCEEGFIAPSKRPGLVGKTKRKLEEEKAQAGGSGPSATKRPRDASESTRVFVGKLPLRVSATAIRDVLGGGVSVVHWLTDKKTGAFYGSVFVQMESMEEARRVMTMDNIKMEKKNLKLNFAPLKEGEDWPPEGFIEKEFPPIGL